MNTKPDNFKRRIEALRMRIKTLSSLRKLVALPPEHDIPGRRWDFLNSQLLSVVARLLSRLKKGAGEYLPHIYNRKAACRLNSLLGEVELELSKAFTFFDTYMDVLTQRHSSVLGPMLAGCDALAWDAIYKDHPALSIIEPPLVYCDRGFGASILREGVLLPDSTPNPMPLIQIPYSRLKEKYNLTSILHEAGHQAMVRLGLTTALPKAFRYALKRSGASDNIRDLFALWTTEIGPDFWGFCASGAAQAASIREIMALPPGHVFRVSWTDPHPPAYLRALLSFEWCRQMWGRGDWDNWEEEWLELYPLQGAPAETLRLLQKARQYIPVISTALLQTKYSVLNRKTIPDLFNLSMLSPNRLRGIARTIDSGTLNLKGLCPSAQLAVFRLVREEGKLTEEELDKLMTKWLIKLGDKNGSFN